MSQRQRQRQRKRKRKDKTKQNEEAKEINTERLYVVLVQPNKSEIS